MKSTHIRIAIIAKKNNKIKFGIMAYNKLHVNNDKAQ
jgi:hypothetical protein